ncbi:alpha/beta hydrolase [Actinomadura sp. KC345]|uniref:alpha/beta fold hydrolase n=1 Tax=Actinomadura sp. KC345 TaxID=2530371 RepID=UPI001050D969|nr:alpha/beta hydrolase [Actinomadura sp. KC345]TDC55118.1 alpha/beta hydrolase [Actinomadura sp. KC345]
MTSYATSADGTRIAYDRVGDGPALILVGGMFCARPATRDLAGRLASRFTVTNYDRRGRGDSGDTPPYAVEREIEDLGALIAEAGGSAAVYGHSSGAGLALEAAAAGLPITRLVLHEPPYGSDDDDSRRAARELAEGVRAALKDDRRADAIKLFLTSSGMPPDMAEGASGNPDMQAIAPTMPYDFAVMGNGTRGGAIPEDLARKVTVPTLLIAGDASPPFFRDTATRLAGLLPDARDTILKGQDHGATAEAVAPPVMTFLTEVLGGASPGDGLNRP